MNRTDQASEPTMEEILASIRLIISDDAKKAFPAREDHPTRPAPPKPEAAPLNALPEEDVLDLTDALAPGEQHSAVAAARIDERHAAAPAVAHAETAESAWAPEDAIAEAPEAAHEADMPQQAEEAEEPAREIHPDPSPLTPPPSRTLWSRRELPPSPPSAAAAPVSRYEAPARPAQRSWAQDIQMPIPNRGPVSLIPGEPQPMAEEPKDAMQSGGRKEAEGGFGAPGSLGEQQEAAVAAIAHSLARSAAGAMDSDELATAVEVDFSKLGEEHKAEVTETFAKAIQKESAPRDADPLPTLLDEVLRHREPSADAGPAGELSEAEAAGGRDESNESAEDERFGPMWGAPPIAAPAPYHAPAPQVRKEPFSRASETFAAPKEAPVAKVFPAASGSPLEDAVRDMLRPLLVQWLNEHMPRILEGAIREEIATRGIFPKTEK